MKSHRKNQLTSLFLTAALVLGSCSSYRQVACPEIDQNNYLARTTSKIKTKAPQRTRQTYAKNLDKLSANKYDTKTNRSTRDAGALVTRDLKPEISPVSSLEAQIDNGAGIHENLIASADNNSGNSGISAYAGEQLRISNATETSVPLELMSPREMRKFNRKFERDLRSMQVAPRAATPSSNAKPAKGLAIAAMVLGISSLVIFPLAGILGIIFGTIALKRIKANPSQEGRGMALAGLICGIVGVAFLVILIAAGFGGLFIL
jgi:hypothetical protein